MSGSEEVNDKDYREAIWKVHNYLCMLCERPLDFADMEIDHVVPESWDRLPESERTENLAAIGLPSDFKILSRLNHAPLHGRCNNRKRATPYPMGVTAIYLNLIGAKQPALTKELALLVKGRTLSVILNMIANSVEKDRFSKEDLADGLRDRGLWSSGNIKSFSVASFENYSRHVKNRVQFSDENLREQILESETAVQDMLRSLQLGRVEARKLILDGRIVMEAQFKNHFRIFFIVESDEITVLELVQKRSN